MKDLGYSLIELQGRSTKAINDQKLYSTYQAVKKDQLRPKTKQQHKLVEMAKTVIKNESDYARSQFERPDNKYYLTTHSSAGYITPALVFLLQFWDANSVPYFSKDSGKPAGIIWADESWDPQGVTYINGNLNYLYGRKSGVRLPMDGLKGIAKTLNENEREVTVTSLDTRTNETTVRISAGKFDELKTLMAEPAPWTNSLPALADHNFQYRSTVIETKRYTIFEWRNGVWVYSKDGETLTYHGNIKGLAHTPNTANEKTFSETYMELLSKKQKQLLSKYLVYKHPETAGERWYKI